MVARRRPAKGCWLRPEILRAIRLTHSHWDHVSGLPDFPGVPGWVTPQERRFISEGGHGQFGKPFTGIRWQLEGITLREERPGSADIGRLGRRHAKNLLRMIALKERLPELNIVPAHDMRAFADMPSSIRPGSKYLQILARSNRSLERENRANFRAKILPFAHGPSFEQWEITG